MKKFSYLNKVLFTLGSQEIFSVFNQLVKSQWDIDSKIGRMIMINSQSKVKNNKSKSLKTFLHTWIFVFERVNVITIASVSQNSKDKHTIESKVYL